MRMFCANCSFKVDSRRGGLRCGKATGKVIDDPALRCPLHGFNLVKDLEAVCAFIAYMYTGD